MVGTKGCQADATICGNLGTVVILGIIGCQADATICGNLGTVVILGTKGCQADATICGNLGTVVILGTQVRCGRARSWSGHRGSKLSEHRAEQGAVHMTWQWLCTP